MGSLTRRAVAALAALSFAWPASTFAQSYPSGPVRLIVGYAPGGSVDIVSRLIAEKLSGDLGQQVVVDNRPGGGTVIASQALVNAKPDGHTLMMADIAHGANPALQPKLPYDTVKDFKPISLVVRFPSVLVVRKDLPVDDLKGFLELAKSKPGMLNYGSSGVGSMNFLGTELLKSTAGLDISHIPYKSGGELMTALLGGFVDVVLTTAPPVLPHLSKVKVLAVSSDKRLTSMPDVPTFAEAGMPDFKSELWQGVLARAGTDQAVVEKLEAAIRKVIERSEVQARIKDLGGELVGRTPQDFAAFIDTEIAKWKSVVTPEMRAN